MTTLGKYEIVEEIGRGGIAVVYKARDTTLGRVVALKVLDLYWAKDPSFVTRFHQEARAAANLRHPNIVTVYEAGEADGQLFIAMEYLQGRTLRELLEVEGALALERALPILEQIADALDAAHGQGIIHRDVKPGNVIVEETGRGVWVTLTDFGLVKAMAGSTALTSTGTLLGSPEYMAPEQAGPERAAEVGPAADRYALGIVAYQMLTGRVPFPGNTPATLNAHEHKPVPQPRSLRPNLPRPVAAALLKMLAKAPGDRYPTAAAFVAALRPVLRSKKEPRQLPPVWAWAAGAGLAAVALIVLVLVLSGCGGGDGKPTDTPISAAAVIPTSTDTPRLTTTLEPSVTPTSTRTATPHPTDTPTPTSTATPRPTDTPTPSEVPMLDIGSTMTRERDSAVMVYAPGGTFQMGSSEAEIDAAFEQCEQNVGSGECSRDQFERESPQHTVTLVSFWIDKYEVTNTQYRQCLEDGACRAPTTCNWGEPTYEDESKADHPVICVDWDGARTYCEWADSRLPTEAEWEYAARGLEGRTYPWGDTFDGERVNFCDANCPEDWKDPDWDDGYELTAPVGSFEEGASWCGALDMAGNVWEWVADWYQEDYYAVSPVSNPTGPEAGEVKVVRGGSWYSYAYHVRSADRGRYDPVDSVSNLGFRCVGAATSISP
jgi:serine/threonine-protein kinase